MEPEKRTLTTGEVARYCDVNLRTVARWIEEGHLKAYKLPGRGDKRVKVEDFLAFLQAYEMPVPEELERNPKRVLVVEDEPEIAELYRRVITGAGFEVEVAEDGFRAGALLVMFKPSVMTLDLVLPGLDGLEVLRFLRGTERLKSVRILVVSALPKEKLRAAVEAGANEAFQKPVKNRDLAEAVTRLAAPATGRS